MAARPMNSWFRTGNSCCNYTASRWSIITAGLPTPEDKPYGNGVLLWFEVEDFDGIVERATEMGVEIVLPRHRNPSEGDGGPNHWECWMRDPDGYVVVVASAYGTADGTWRPEGNPFGS